MPEERKVPDKGLVTPSNPSGNEHLTDPPPMGSDLIPPRPKDNTRTVD
jgi:hypothetical protein